MRQNLRGELEPWRRADQGIYRDEIIGAHFSRFYTDEDRAVGVPEKALKIAAETGRFTTESCRRRKDSRFWAMVVIEIRRADRLIGFAKITAI